MGFFAWLKSLFSGSKPAIKDTPAKPETAPPSASETKPRPGDDGQPVPSDAGSPEGGPSTSGSANIRILLPPFKGDAEGKFRARYMETLTKGGMLEITEIDESPDYPGAQPSAAKLTELFKNAGELLERRGAELLILGELRKSGLRLRTVPSGIPPEGRPDSMGMADTLIIPPNFGAELANLIYAGIIAAALPEKDRFRGTLLPYLAGAAEQSRRLLADTPEDLSPEQLASIMTQLGVVSASLWRSTGKSTDLQNAVSAFRAAVSKGPKEVSPTVLAELKIRLGVGLQTLAEIQNSEDLYEEAADTLQGIAEVLSRKTNKREWGLAYLCLGNLMLARAKSEMESAYCSTAVSAFDALKDTFTKDSDPARWADVMSQRGTAYLTWGSMEAGTSELQSAVETFREVQAVRDHNVAPLLWAHAASNLGNACFALAKRTKDAELMREAAGCFDGAMAVYQQHGHTQAVGVLRKNVQRVERLQSTGDG